MGMTYHQTMEWGAAQYADVTAALAERGLRAEFTQTGGMCAAIEALLDGGHYLLITDGEDTLSWVREEHAGWWVGLYPPHEADADGPIRCSDSVAGDVQALLACVDRVLRPAA